jgi:Lipase maturation factor
MSERKGPSVLDFGTTPCFSQLVVAYLVSITVHQCCESCSSLNSITSPSCRGPSEMGSAARSQTLFLRLLGWCHAATGFTGALQNPVALELFSSSGGAGDFASQLSPYSPFFWLFGAGPAAVLCQSLCQIFLGSFLIFHRQRPSFAVPLMLYMLQLSVLNAPPFQPFIGNYGWEWQLAEVSALAVFICPFSLSPWAGRREYVAGGGDDSTATERFARAAETLCWWLVRFSAFRVMWGAGMSKLGAYSSPCWRWPEMSCTQWHYETMPLPNPLAFFMHHLPVEVHRGEVLFNHFTELVAPYALVVPFFPRLRSVAAAACIAYMCAIMSTGSYAIINLITVTVLVSSLDDNLLARVPLVSRLCGDGDVAVEQPARAQRREAWKRIGTLIGALSRFLFIGLIIFKSIEPIKESLSPAPWLKTYDKFYLAPAYGVFGFVNKKRFSIALHVSNSSATASPNANWSDLQLKCLPGQSDALPCVSIPGYHYRLDWDTWIRVTASLEHPRADRSRFLPPALMRALQRLVNGDEAVYPFFRTPESGDLRDVRAVRVTLVRDSYNSIAEWRKTGHWWVRRRVPGIQPIAIEAGNQRSGNLQKQLLRESRTSICAISMTSGQSWIVASLVSLAGAIASSRQFALVSLGILCAVAASDYACV